MGDLAMPDSSWRSAEGRDVDLVIGIEDWWPALIALAQADRDGQGLPILPFSGQVWRKLRAGRTVDAGDLSRLLGLASDEQIAEARTLLQAHAARDDLQDFEGLVHLGRLEFSPRRDT